MGVSTDTAPAAAEVWADTFRKMPVRRKWRMLEDAFAAARALHAAGMRLRDPGANSVSIHRAWIKAHYGLDCNGDPIMPPEQGMFDALRQVVRVLESLKIAYALGGSMASSIHGIARFTRDADITVEPFPGKEKALASAFGQDVYVSLPAIEDALKQRTSFNIIFTRDGFKVDVFVRKENAFEREAMARRVFIAVEDKSEPIAVFTAEDIVLFKLQWYRLGAEQAGQQLDDVRGIFQAQTGRLDNEYLDRWAAFLKVHDLLRSVRD